MINYSDRDQTSIAGCKLRLRTYNQNLVGPTFRVKPGETLTFAVDNQLQQRAPSHDPSGHEDIDVTNLHTHGLHVYPGNGPNDRTPSASDNVLIRQPPPPNPQPYEIAIPPDHPSGTFWYHAHAHGSTAQQVSSGMSGALIVEDNPDNLPPALRDIKEQIMVFQSIFYDAEGEMTDLANVSGNAWQASGRRITINGQLVPVIRMQPGEVQRWRMIGSQFKESLELRLAGHALNEIALDSLYLPRVDRWNEGQAIDLQAGYRSDVLVKASMTPGTYFMEDAPNTAGKDSLSEDSSIVAALVVEGDPVDDPLPTDAEMRAIAYQPDVDLSSEWDPARPPQEVIFDIGFQQNAADPPIPAVTPPPSPPPSPAPTPSPDTTDFMINGQQFVEPGNPGYTERNLELGKIDKWLLTSAAGFHAFHIHVNPFQVIRTGPDGAPERVWKDTILVPGPAPSPYEYPQNRQPQIPPIEVFTRYDTKLVESAPYDAAAPPFNDFTGKYVIHCHFLDHEDAGMMQVIDLKVR